MTTKKKNLSYQASPVPSAADMSFGIVVAEWNPEVTHALLDGALERLRQSGCPEDNISVKWVPGSFELALGAHFFTEYTNVDAVIVLGCVVQGETRHFDFLCQGVTQGIIELQLSTGLPIVFGVLTTLTMEQAMERAGGQHGNKGDEAAATAIKMVSLQNQMYRDRVID
ncbi:MAG: 6,7-dimethyl-8-ribityllumazine synthase, partial [Mucinivorans sp.]